jgi:hypothetical protein
MNKRNKISAVFSSRDHYFINFGMTGDLWKEGPDLRFRPHGDKHNYYVQADEVYLGSVHRYHRFFYA